MHRRHFLRLAPWLPGTAYLLACGNTQNKQEATVLGKLPLTIHSDMHTGHLLWEASQLPQGKDYRCETLVVGGGIAGLAAAYQLRKTDVLLCELSEQLGGTAGAYQFENDWFGQGAHYDLVYPNYFGKEVLAFLEDLGIISYSQLGDNWIFTDKHYMIDPKEEGRARFRGVLREDVLPDTHETDTFLKKMEMYESHMKLPTPDIAPSYKELDGYSFREWLNRHHGDCSDELLACIDYQMLDDFGGTAAEVSALAGVYYYASRHYNNKDIETFSPPEGNYYFIRRMAEHLAPEQLLTQRLVSRIYPEKQGFRVEVLNVKDHTKHTLYCRRIVYAANKHALKYVFPADYPAFAQQMYSPWLVLNFVLRPDKDDLPQGFWQNEIIEPGTPRSKSFLGFVDSSTQYQFQRNRRGLTAYFCLPARERKSLQNTDYQDFVRYAAGSITRWFEITPAQFVSAIEQVFVKVMGHAMPIPTPNYLFKDRNTARSQAGLVYAGVDNSRLPLMLEALDSSLQALKWWNKA